MGLNVSDLPKNSHSNYEFKEKDGSSKISTERACYSEVWTLPLESMTVYFPVRYPERVEEWVEEVINGPLWGECFLTKDVQEGLNEGFKMNVEIPRNFFFTALAAIRLPWESSNYQEWSFPKWRELDFSVMESIWLGVNYDRNDAYVWDCTYNSNHIPFKRGIDYHHILKKEYKYDPCKMSENGIRGNVSDSWDTDCKHRLISETIPDYWANTTLYKFYKEKENHCEKGKFYLNDDFLSNMRNYLRKEAK